MPHFNLEFLPAALSHLASHFRILNWSFPSPTKALALDATRAQAHAKETSKPWGPHGFCCSVPISDRRSVRERQLSHLENPSHVIPVMIKDPVKCRMLSDFLT